MTEPVRLVQTPESSSSGAAHFVAVVEQYSASQYAKPIPHVVRNRVRHKGFTSASRRLKDGYFERPDPFHFSDRLSLGQCRIVDYVGLAESVGHHLRSALFAPVVFRWLNVQFSAWLICRLKYIVINIIRSGLWQVSRCRYT